MRTMILVLIVSLWPLIGGSSAGADEGDSTTLAGSVVLRDPAALPPGALLTVALEDVSLADAPAVTLAQTQFEVKDQQPPIPFSLVYPTAAAKPGAVLAVRARLTLGDRLLYTTTDHNQFDVLNPLPVTLILDPVPAADPPPTPDASLTDTYWKLTVVGDTPIQVVEQMREPQVVLNGQDRRFAGSGGVNRLMGSYILDGPSLTFAETASTMMAGPPEAMQQEQAIITALSHVHGYRIAGNQLTLLDGGGQPVLQAVAVAL